MLERFVNRTQFSSWEDFSQNFQILVPEDFNFGFDVVDEIAKKDPERPALHWCDEDGHSAKLTFEQIRLRSNRVANFLRSKGIGKGDAVMLILKRRYEFWYSMVALHKIGAVAIPATHLLTTKDIVYRCNAADIKAIISVTEERIQTEVDGAVADSPTLAHKIAINGSRPGWESLEERMADAGDEFHRPAGEDAPSSTDVLVTYFTSGTTGLPKMVQHGASYPLGHILTAKFWQNVRPGGLHLTVADTGWAKTAWGKIYGQWIAGAAVLAYDMERFVPQKLLEVVSECKVSTFCAPPTVFRYLIQEDLSQYDLSALEYCVVAGEPLNPEVYNAWLKATGLRLMEGFGQTETVVILGNYPWFDPRPGSTGKPSPGWDIDLLNDEGEPCGVGEPGQIVVRTSDGVPPGMFRGYYRDDELTREMWHDGLYYTGDLAWRDEDGYYWFVGRADDIIKTSGYRVGPFEVESALLEHPAVTECAVTAVPDAMRGQVVKATCVLSKEYAGGDELAKELQEHVKSTTAPYKYPRIVEFVDVLPKTISGKIRRTEIREQDKERSQD